MTCCPDTNELPRANQDQPYYDSREMRLCKNDQQKRPNKYWNPSDLFHIHDTIASFYNPPLLPSAYRQAGLLKGERGGFIDLK
jgi:hypothetical protein